MRSSWGRSPSCGRDRQHPKADPPGHGVHTLPVPPAIRLDQHRPQCGRTCARPAVNPLGRRSPRLDHARGPRRLFPHHRSGPAWLHRLAARRRRQPRPDSGRPPPRHSKLQGTRLPVRHGRPAARNSSFATGSQTTVGVVCPDQRDARGGTTYTPWSRWKSPPPGRAGGGRKTSRWRPMMAPPTSSARASPRRSCADRRGCTPGCRAE